MLRATQLLQCKKYSAIGYSWPDPYLRNGCTDIS